MAMAIVLDLPPKLCHERNQARPDRRFGFEVVRRHASQLRRGLRDLRREEFRHVAVLDSPEAIDQATIERTRLWTDRRDDRTRGCSGETIAAGAIRTRSA